MSMSVQFNGVELNEILDVVQGFTPFDGANMSPSFSSLPTGGSRYLSTINTLKVFDMPFIMRNDKRGTQQEKYDRLEKILNVDEPKQLIFGAMPDRYFMAIPNGTLSYDETVFQGKGHIQWAVGDGLGHALTETIFTPSPNSDGILEATIINNGTAPVPVRYEIEHGSDNGFIGITSEYGAMEFGKREELDGEDYVGNQQIFSTDTFTDWVQDTGLNSQNIHFATNGTLVSDTFEGRKVVRLSDAGSGDYWHGGQWMYTVANPKKSFYSYFNAVFQTGLIPQSGLFVLSFLDESGNNVCSYTITKHITNSNWSDVQMYVGNQLVKKTSFLASHRIEDNQFCNSAGHCSISKVDDLFSFYYRGYPGFEFREPSLKETKIAKIQLYLAQIKDRTLADSDYMTRSFLRSMSFVQVNVDLWRDIPNRYAKGSKVTIDGETKMIYVNGMETLGDEILGTKYFLVPPGETKVKIHLSSFAKNTNIKCYIREAWI